MKAISIQRGVQRSQQGPVTPGAAPEQPAASGDGIDLGLLEDSLAKTPWERMQANDDALRFANSLREAMQRRNARS